MWMQLYTDFDFGWHVATFLSVLHEPLGGPKLHFGDHRANLSTQVHGVNFSQKLAGFLKKEQPTYSLIQVHVHLHQCWCLTFLNLATWLNYLQQPIFCVVSHQRGRADWNPPQVTSYNPTVKDTNYPAEIKQDYKTASQSFDSFEAFILAEQWRQD